MQVTNQVEEKQKLGMADEIQKKIFERRSRLEGSGRARR